MEKVRTALALIYELDPRLLRRLRDDLSFILVIHSRNPRFWVASQACVLDEELVDLRSEAFVALAIVHEATHARVERAGVHLYPPLVPRIEALCRAEELRFAKMLPVGRFPGKERLVEYLAAR